MHPCFYADDAGDLFLSPSTEALARHPRIPGTIDTIAIAEHLCQSMAETRVDLLRGGPAPPGGYAMRVRDGKRTVARYWDPIPPVGRSTTSTDEEAERFPELLDQAVSRCLPGGPAAIYLSGGLDSVSVAALAQEQLRDQDGGPLLALSLIFEHPDANEEGTQRAVAGRLGLPQKIVTVRDAVGPNGLLADALEMSASRSAPMMNLWNPAYAFLGRYAAEHGCEVILTGNGGDEWLEAGVHNARLALQRLDFATVFRLWACMQRSYPAPRAAIARNLLWTFGMRPILSTKRSAYSRAPRLERSHGVSNCASLRRRHRGSLEDRGLRAEMFERYRAHKRTRWRGALDSSMVAYELEEFYESGQRRGSRSATRSGMPTSPPSSHGSHHVSYPRRLFERARAAVVGPEVSAARLRAEPEGHSDRLLSLSPDRRDRQLLEEAGSSASPGRARRCRRTGTQSPHERSLPEP